MAWRLVDYLFKYAEEVYDAENDTYKIVDAHKRTEKREDDSDNGNTCKDSDKETDDCSDNKEITS